MDSTASWSSPDTGNIVSCVSLLIMLSGGVVSIGGFVMISSDYPNDNPLMVVGPVLAVCGFLITAIGVLVCILVVKPACCFRERAEKLKNEMFSTAVSSPSTEYVTTDLGPLTPSTSGYQAPPTLDQAPPFTTVGSSGPPPSMSYVPVSFSSDYTPETRQEAGSGDNSKPMNWN